MLHPMVLGAVATTLAAAEGLQQALQQGDSSSNGSEQGRFPALRELGASIGDALPGLRADIERCIQVR